MRPDIKQDWLNLAKEHAAAAGCFFGCMTQSENNTIELAAEQMNSPRWIVALAERIFEGLPGDEAIKFRVQYMEAIPANLSQDDYESIRHKLGALRMQRLLDLVSAIETEASYKQECLDALTLAKDYHAEPSESAAESAARSAAWSAAESAAWSAAESAAWSAERSEAESARSAAWSAAWSAESAAESAERSAESARSAAESAARSAESAAESAERSAESAERSAESARSAAYEQERDDLLSVFKECEVTP